MSRDAQSRGRLLPGRPGFFVALAAALIAGCSNGEAPRDVVELESGEVQLPAGARRHDIRLEGVGAEGEVDPASVDAAPGDAVAFIAGDGITHSVMFLADRMDGSQVAFLDSTSQRRGPPLLSEGSTWVVSLVAAPPGDYAFACALHGGAGTVRVAARD